MQLNRLDHVTGSGGPLQMNQTHSIPNDTKTVIITDRTTKAEIGCTHIQLNPDMDEIAVYRAAHIALTLWSEKNGRNFNELDWNWQPPANDPLMPLVADERTPRPTSLVQFPNTACN
jgi:hypothetical protein